MAVLESLKKGLDYIGSLFEPKKEGARERSRNVVYDTLAEHKETSGDVEKIRAEAEKERGSIFGEVWESVLARYFPNVSKIMDIATTVTPLDKDPEAVPWQNEFETITAFSLLVPDFLLHIITDRFAKSQTFIKIVERWPFVNQGWVDKIKAPNCDPDDVINILRIMHQDIISGKVTMSSVLNK